MIFEKDRDRILEEVAGESLPAGFRETLLEQTLHHVRRRRRYRQAFKGAAALAAAFVVGLVFLMIRRMPLPVERVAPAYEVVQTKAFPTEAIVSTTPLRADQLVTVVFTANEIHTQQDSLGYRSISDDELLALVANRSGVLLRIGPAEQKLVFPNENDQRGFPIN